MSPVTRARVAVIQDAQTLCIYYTDYWLLPLRPPFWMAPQLSQSESQMRVSVRVCLLQALIWCYYSADGETGCGSQELLVDSTCLRPGLVTPRYILQKQRAETDKGWKQFLLSSCLPLKQHPSMSPQHTLVFVFQRLVVSVSHIPSPATCSSFIFLRHSCICK